MEIINESDQDATWWCYNSDDRVKMIALKQGDLRANGGRTSYDPPNNATGAYSVLLTVKGGGGTYDPGPALSGEFGRAVARQDGTVRLRGSCKYEAVAGPQGGGGQIEIINESDCDVTWWCFNSNDFAEEVPHKKGDLKAKGGRISYGPPSNATGAYTVLITDLGGHATYRDWAPSATAILGRAKVPSGGTIIFRGSCGYEVVGTGTAAGQGYQIG
ncbi:MAG: hypothetical protein ACREH3_06890 [Geminicoccales bacterium]